MNEQQQPPLIVNPAPFPFGVFFSTLAWIVVLVAVPIAAFCLYESILANGAPAQAAGAAVACGLVVIPYCFARAIDGLRQK